MMKAFHASHKHSHTVYYIVGKTQRKIINTKKEERMRIRLKLTVMR